MRKRNFRKGKFSPQTFDPEDFDVWELQHFVRSKIWPKQRGEKTINVRAELKKIKKSKTKIFKKEITKKSFTLILLGNAILPGIGNIYIEKNPFTVAILGLSIITVFATFSPLFPVTQLLEHIPITQSVSITGTIIAPYSFSASQAVPGAYIPNLSFVLFPLILSWVHLMYQFMRHERTHYFRV